MIGATGATYGADTHYVSLAGTNDSPYTNGWASAATNIQWAVDQAIADDTVLVSNGTYNLTNEIIITVNITVRSFTEQGHGTNDTIVDGGYPTRSNRCFVLNAGVGTVDGFSIRNGYNTNLPHHNGGGGVYLTGASILKNCFVYNNIATQGEWTCSAGVNCRSGWTGMISNCTIAGNTGHARGGGIFTYDAAGLIVGCHISENTATEGAGIWTGGATITSCTVNANTSLWNGGGIWSSGSSGLITDCVISNNTCVNGHTGGVALYGTMRNSVITRNNSLVNNIGGVYMVATAPGVTLVSNCLVTANSAAGDAGGIELNGNAGSGVIANCAISGNSGGGWSAGVYIFANGAYPQLMKNCLVYGTTGAGAGVRIAEIGQYPYGLINCTIADNLGTSGWNFRADTGTNNYIGNCVVYGTGIIYNATAANTNNYWYNCTTSTIVAGQGNITNNPLFIDTVNGNYRLSARSPCVNTGTNGNWTATDVDLDGRTRIRYTTVDMGAYEFIRSGTIFGFH